MAAGNTLGLNQFSNYRLARPFPPDDQCQCFVTTLAFNNLQISNAIDLSADDRVLDFSAVSVYIDNSSVNSVNVLFIVAGTGQRLIAKANTQGFYTVLTGDRKDGAANLAFQVQAPSAGVATALVQVILFNYLVPPAVWATV